jgi:hypothetical protein
MAWTEGDDDNTLNGTTEVTLVPAPAAATRRIVPLGGISIQNRDTAVVTVTVRKVSAGGTRQIWKGDLDPGDTWYNDDVIVLSTTAKSVRAVMSAVAATTNPDWISSWGDAT